MDTNNDEAENYFSKSSRPLGLGLLWFALTKLLIASFYTHKPLMRMP